MAAGTFPAAFFCAARLLCDGAVCVAATRIPIQGLKGHHMRKTGLLASLGLFAALLATQPLAAQEFSMLGTWTGHRERIAEPDGYREGTATMVVSEQKGGTFKGYLKWSTSTGDMQDPMVGAFTPGGKLIAGADAEGTYSFSLIDQSTLDYCYAEHGTSFRTTCGRLTKQP